MDVRRTTLLVAAEIVQTPRMIAGALFTGWRITCSEPKRETGCQSDLARA